MKIQSNPVSWFEIYVQDIHRAQLFYEALFEKPLTPLPSDGSFQALSFPGIESTYGAMGALMQHPHRHPHAEGTIIYFHVKDCQTYLERAITLGALVVRAKWSIGENGFIALITDSEGNTIGLHSFQ